MRMHGRGLAAGLLLALCVLLGAASAHAQAYRWQDEQGQSHFTDDPGQIPARFRGQAQPLELPESTSAPAQQAAEATDGNAESLLAQAVDDALRSEWPELPAVKRHAAAAAVLDRLALVLAALAIHSLATLAMFGHAVASGQRLWALGNLLVPVVPPFYALLKLEGPALKKAGIVVAWATGPAAGIALQWTLAQIGI